MRQGWEPELRGCTRAGGAETGDRAMGEAEPEAGDR